MTGDSHVIEVAVRNVSTVLSADGNKPVEVTPRQPPMAQTLHGKFKVACKYKYKNTAVVFPLCIVGGSGQVDFKHCLMNSTQCSASGLSDL